MDLSMRRIAGLGQNRRRLATAASGVGGDGLPINSQRAATAGAASDTEPS
jgi:hypothetical protein